MLRFFYAIWIDFCIVLSFACSILSVEAKLVWLHGRFYSHNNNKYQCWTTSSDSNHITVLKKGLSISELLGNRQLADTAHWLHASMFSVSGQTEAAVVDPAGWTAPTSREFLRGENQKSPEGPAEGAEAWRPLVDDQLAYKATRIQVSEVI